MENINLLPESEYTETDGRLYLQPNLPVTQTNEFIDKYRANQIANNNQIAQQTRNLGTSVPSNLGGLTGAGSYFTSRYQTPQTNAVAQNLRTAAQAQALNTALANEQAYWQKKYQDAYRAYQKRQYNKANTPTTTTPTGGGDEEGEDPEFVDSSKTINGDVPGVAGGYTTALFDTDTGAVLGYSGVPFGEEGKTEYRTYLEDTESTPTRQKGSYGVFGNNTTYIHTLPNGHTVAVDESKYDLINNNGSYALKDKNTGEEFPVGG